VRLIRTAAAVVPAIVAAALLVVPPAAADPGHRPAARSAYYDSGLAPTPYMGWNTYFGLGGDPTDAEVRSVTDFMVHSGLRDAGYRIVWIDGNWAAPTPRNGQGQLVADPARFPAGMADLTRYIHAHGMKAGIYTDAGPYIEGQCGLGSYGHYTDDVNLFARWGFDALKVDWLCGRASGMDPETTYRQLSAAVQRSPRPLILNICNPVSSDWGGGPYPPEALSTWSYTYAPGIADSWRTYTDVGLVDPQPQWQYQWVLRNMDVNAYHPAATGPGHYNDPDYLVPMRPLPGGGYEMTFDESKTQLGMWAMMSAPLVIGSDPRALPAQMIAALRDPEIVAVDQDPLVQQAVKVADTSSTTQVWSKVLSGTGQRAVALLNRGDTAQQITVDYAAVALGGTVGVRDLWARADLPTSPGGSYTATVPAHGVAMLKLTGTDLVTGTDLGPTTDSPALVRFDDTHTDVFSRGPDGTLWENGHSLGKRILGQPAVYGSPAGRIDVFVRGTDNAVWHNAYVNAHWTTWTSLGGAISDAPTVAFTSPTQWTIVARSATGLVETRSAAASAWTGIGAPNNWPIYGRPSAVVDASGQLHVAVRARTDEIWEYTAGTWTDLGGTLSAAPTLLATSGRIYLFALAADNRLWQRNEVDGSWGGWFQRGEYPTAAFQGAVGAAPGDNGSAWLVVRGVDNHIHESVL
jgi:alpha-galactosidase